MKVFIAVLKITQCLSIIMRLYTEGPCFARRRVPFVSVFHEHIGSSIKPTTKNVFTEIRYDIIDATLV